MRWGNEFPEKHDLSSSAAARLGRRADQPRGVGLVPRAHRRRPDPVVDTWWQTETGSILITPLPGIDHAEARLGHHRRSRASAPTSWTSRAKYVPCGAGGYLVLTRPWPSMMRTIWGDAERYKEQYWSRFPGVYFTGDGARRDEDGYFWLLGRVDDVLNVAGHRIGTMEVESALVSHPSVAEAAVIGISHEIKGQALAVVRHAARRRRRQRGAAERAARARRRRRSARSRGPTRSTSPPSCPRRVAPRSCAACCATSPKVG